MEFRDGRLRLSTRDRVTGERPPPAENDVNGWAARGDGARRWWLPAASAPVRRAGTQGVVQSFFDELFNHLDPYSRYVPPRDAGEDRERRIGQAGAGLRLVRRGSAIVVAEAISRRTGALAGIRPGDTILSVDGQSTRGQGCRHRDELDRRAGGDPRSRLPGAAATAASHTAELERAMVPPETVFAQRIGEVLVIQVTAFNRSTDSHLAQCARARPGRSASARGHRPRPARQSRRPAAAGGHRGGRAAARRHRGDHRRTRSRGVTDLALRLRRAWPGIPGRRHGRRPLRQRGRNPGRRAGRPRPRRGDRQLDARQGAGADDRPAAGRRRTVRDLEPRAGAARLADPGPWRAAAGLHQPRAGTR